MYKADPNNTRNVSTITAHPKAPGFKGRCISLTLACKFGGIPYHSDRYAIDRADARVLSKALLGAAKEMIGTGGRGPHRLPVRLQSAGLDVSISADNGPGRFCLVLQVADAHVSDEYSLSITKARNLAAELRRLAAPWCLRWLYRKAVA